MVGASLIFLLIFLLPWMILGLTLVLLAMAVLSWIKGYWGTVRRVYYSINALAAVLFTAALLQAGFMWVVFG